MTFGDPGEAYITLVLTDSYLVGALVLAHSLRDVGSTKALAVMIVPGLQQSTQDALREAFDYVISVEPINIVREDNLELLGRPDLRSVFTKLRVWQQTQFQKVVYIDADVVALRNPDDLFELESEFAAAPDSGWPDSFNSGVFLTKPSEATFIALNALAEGGVSFDGADQGLLNQHFTNWTRISFTYNVTPSGHYQYLPAYRHFAANVRLVHFIGAIKPWNLDRSVQTNGAYSELSGKWWAVWEKYVKHTCPVPSCPGVSKSISSSSFYPGTSGVAYTQHEPCPPSFYNAVWDAQKTSPRNTIPEAPALEGARLINKWDEPYHRKKSSFIPPHIQPPPPIVRYSIPKPEQTPRAIFPWEANQRPATRIFPDDEEHESLRLVTSDAEEEERERDPGYASSEGLGSFEVHNSWDTFASIISYSDSIAEKIDASEPLVLSEQPERLEGNVSQSPDFPPAEGIPSPTEWDPEVQLDELVKNKSHFLGDSEYHSVKDNSRRSLSLRMPDNRDSVAQELGSPPITFSETATEDTSPLTATTETSFSLASHPFGKEIGSGSLPC